MRILLDTHILIWMVDRPDELSARERQIIAGASHRLVSVASIWELRIKWNTLDRMGRHKGPISPDVALSALAPNGIELAALEGEDCIARLHPALNHRDPFDEMLLVHAQRLDARLLTRDAKLLDHPLALQA